MNSIDFTKNGGADVSQNVLAFMQDSYVQALAAIAKLVGSKTILHGVELSAGVVSDGWIAYNGELVRFVGGTHAAKVVINTTPTGRVYADNVTRDMLFEVTATCGSVGLFDFSELRRLGPMTDIWLPGDLKQVVCDGPYIAANFDGTGLGINSRKGWAVCNGQNGTADMGGRVMVGHTSVTVDPANNVWDVAYNTMLATGGQKLVTLADEQQGTLTLKTKMDDIGGGTTSVISHLMVNSLEVPRNGGSNQTTYGSEVKVYLTDAENGHENRQPFRVVLFIQKIS